MLGLSCIVNQNCRRLSWRKSYFRRPQLQSALLKVNPFVHPGQLFFSQEVVSGDSRNGNRSQNGIGRLTIVFGVGWTGAPGGTNAPDIPLSIDSVGTFSSVGAVSLLTES